MNEPEQSRHHAAGSWHDVDQDSERFRRLLAKYDDDFQRATDAYLRGEDAAPTAHGSENPM